MTGSSDEGHEETRSHVPGYVASAILGAIVALIALSIVAQLGYTSDFPDCWRGPISSGELVQGFSYDDGEDIKDWVSALEAKSWHVYVEATHYGWQATATCPAWEADAT